MYAIEMQGITKTFHGSYANKEVSLKVEQGEIHSLLGENGAGKTTLMKILFGLYKADKGRILINGSPAAIRSPHDAIDYGISMVHQHFVLVGNLTITENIILGHEPRKGILLDRGKARQKVEALIRRYHFGLNPESRIENLSVGEKQRVEILKALYNESSIILLDEPTAVLTPQEVQELFAMLRQLKKDGRTIIIITHKLKETLAIADNVTILRRGENIASLPAAQATEDKLAELMVGRPISFDVQRSPYDGSGPVKLGLKNICLKKKGRPVLTGISLECRAGEILGIAGVEGNGQKELAEVITGIQKTGEGEILLDGQNLAGINIRGRYEAGVSYISEDRLSDSLITGMNISENLVLREYGKPPFANHSIINKAAIRKNAAEKMKQYQVRASGKSGIDTLVKLLSGGNQQKLIIARELNDHAKVIVASQPTRGLDIGATEFVRQQLIDQRNAGKGVMLISADLEEIMALSDRIAVLFGGKIVGILDREEATVQKIGLLMGGISEEEAR